MRDNWTNKRINQLHPRLRAEAESAINEAESNLPSNVSIRLTSVYRSANEQNELYAQGRTKSGKVVTNAKAYQSMHQWGLALDFVLIIDNKVADWSTSKDRDKDGVSDWMEVINAFTKRGWKSGAHFKSLRDYPHLEAYSSLGWRELLRRWNNGETFIDKTNGQKYVNL